MLHPRRFSESISKHSLRNGYSQQTLCEVSGYPIFSLHRLSKGAARPPLRVYVSAGVHGDEPAGPLAILKLIEEDLLPHHLELVVVPLVNPTGFAKGTRENQAGHDLNRDFRTPQNAESSAVKALIESEAPFDLSLSLHEDWESTGFYMYSISPDSNDRSAREILSAVERQGPLDHSPEIDGSPASGALIDRPADFDIDGRQDWPEAFLLYSKSRHAHYTLETPSSAPIEQRVAQHVAAVLRAIEIHCP
ncbi:M14 family metallocarboxypeptidase [Pelagicoccus enzymogenes]|uniref:M14 family metallopeptidase n=1 Tax=Pelagicoccus enzymogenes TaxID=2773457 RepID=UPI00280CEDC8|nr:M14 family metallocarboxypeptidase [Pelagicoccus enzymogenes]MDQ8197604.1 M14 family metallocarboxypeptidase [Pelagicoccus enzymogenes]